MWLVLEQTPKIELLEGNTIIFLLQKLLSSSQNSDASSQSSISISSSRADRVEPGPYLALLSSRAGRVGSRLDPSLICLLYKKNCLQFFSPLSTFKNKCLYFFVRLSTFKKYLYSFVSVYLLSQFYGRETQRARKELRSSCIAS